MSSPSLRSVSVRIAVVFCATAPKSKLAGSASAGAASVNSRSAETDGRWCVPPLYAAASTWLPRTGGASVSQLASPVTGSTGCAAQAAGAVPSTLKATVPSAGTGATWAR